jgi:uncharacterized protein (TIGR02145 family)
MEEKKKEPRKMTRFDIKQFKRALEENNQELIEGISNLLNCANAHRFGTVKILGRKHKTIVIGQQEWMVENLFCPELGFHYENDYKKSQNGYGTLHTYYAIPAIQKLLSDGWRVPSDIDWKRLINFVGDNSCKKLKSKTGWKDGGNGTDDFGFSVLPAGNLHHDGSPFSCRGYESYFWSSSAYSSPDAWYQYFHYRYATVYRLYFNRSFGFSIRCVRD